MSHKIYILNGPNLNLVGVREPEIYGTETLQNVATRCRALCPEGISIVDYQSNHEGQLIDWIHEARDEAAAIIINAGAYTHTSIAILDALRAYQGIVVELHISQIHKRESFRHHSYVAQRADVVLEGMGVEGYLHATRFICEKLGYKRH